MENKKLTQDEIKTRLNSVDKWIFIDNKIEKEFDFNSFEEAMNFVNNIARIAKKFNHHPDVFISYDTVLVTILTHKINGLTQRDFDLAHEIDKLHRGLK